MADAIWMVAALLSVALARPAGVLVERSLDIIGSMIARRVDKDLAGKPIVFDKNYNLLS